MSFEHASDDRWIELARGLLPPAERRVALRHLESCAACEERFRSICREAEILALHGPPPLAAAREPARRWIWVATAAASVLLAAVLGGVLVRQRKDAEVDPWLPVDSERVMLRSLPSSDDNDAFLEALDAYSRHDSRRVVELLAGRALPPQHEFLGLFLASAQVREKKYRDAITTLERLDVETLPQPYRDRARWEEHVALQRTGRVNEARELLELLAAHPGELHDRAARELSRFADPRSE